MPEKRIIRLMIMTNLRIAFRPTELRVAISPRAQMPEITEMQISGPMTSTISFISRLNSGTARSFTRKSAVSGGRYPVRKAAAAADRTARVMVPPGIFSSLTCQGAISTSSLHPF